MSSGMYWVELLELEKRFANPLLVEVAGDYSHLAGEGVEVVDVQDDGNGVFTILHVPGGTLPMPVTRAIGISYFL